MAGRVRPLASLHEEAGDHVAEEGHQEPGGGHRCEEESSV